MTDISLKKLQALIARGGRAAAGGPKYARVSEAFAEAIGRGDFMPGQRIPAERELCSHLPVSLGTLQKAMGKLAAAGLIVRNRRTGTFVADRSSQASEAFVYRFKDPANGRCIRLDRLLWIENEPPALTSVYFTLEHGRTLLDVPIEELHGSSTHRVMADQFSLPSLRFEHRIGCRALTPEACQHLRVAGGTVGTVWDVSDFSFDDRPVLFQRLQLPPGHRPIEIVERFAANS